MVEDQRSIWSIDKEEKEGRKDKREVEREEELGQLKLKPR